MSSISKGKNWWVYRSEDGFAHLGGFSVRRHDSSLGPITRRKLKVDLLYDTEQMKRSVQSLEFHADELMPRWQFVLQGSDISNLMRQCESALHYLKDLEEEHWENMRHDAEGG